MNIKFFMNIYIQSIINKSEIYDHKNKDFHWLLQSLKILLLAYEMDSQIVREAAQPLQDDHQHMPTRAAYDHCLLFVD